MRGRPPRHVWKLGRSQRDPAGRLSETVKGSTMLIHVFCVLLVIGVNCVAACSRGFKYHEVDGFTIAANEKAIREKLLEENGVSRPAINTVDAKNWL